MWRLNINEPERDSYWMEIKPGATSIGRNSTCTITIFDPSASRQHAEIVWEEAKDCIIIRDLNSINGTYVNRKRILDVGDLKSGDNIRIGEAILHLTDEIGDPRVSLMGTHFFTREIILESLDEHAVMLDEVAQKLSTQLDIPCALQEITAQLKRILMVKEARVVLMNEFPSLQDEYAIKAIQNLSVEIIQTQMYVPIAVANETLGVICLTRNENPRPFSQRDMGLAVAISHQSALTLNRLQLLEKNRELERMRGLLLRFVSPLEVNYLLKDYLATGALPDLIEQKITVLFLGITDFIGIAERLGSQRFAKFLTSYYQDITNIIFRYGGIVKYMDDGVMAAFVSTSKTNTVVPQELRAVQAGWQILSQFKRNQYVFDGEQINVGIAVNTGPAMAGYIGTGERAEFTVLGDTVNIASRMEPYARPNRMLVGPATQLAIQGRFTTNAFDTLHVRGRSASVPLFEVLGV